VLASAGMMELFAHGQDIADALGVRRQRTDRIMHIAGFAARTWDFGYQARGLPTPDVQFRFDLTAPSGKVWTFGPEEAEQRISGPAVEFCLLATRRRHRADLAVTAVGDDAEAWLDIAQCYRGPAGPGRERGQFAD
jgi:enediyne biosynthesis protein E11